MIMNVLLVDADSKKGFPNLALMKLSAWHKQQGDVISFIKGIPTTAPLEHFDKIYISNIFFQNRNKVLDYAKQFKDISIGGSGFDYSVILDHDVEHIMPDYYLYGLNYSLGFTSRGCIRACGFCIVHEKEGFIRDNAPIQEFHNLEHDKIMLLDNNFQASPRWKENLQYIIDNKLKVNFNQGLDIRLLNDEFLSMLVETQYVDQKFKRKSLYFAFDDLRYKDEFKEGMTKLIDSGINPRNIMIYILVGYNSTINEDLERIKTVIHFGAIPYIMRYNQSKDKTLAKLARWVNRRYYQFMEWEVYK